MVVVVMAGDWTLMNVAWSTSSHDAVERPLHRVVKAAKLELL